MDNIVDTRYTFIMAYANKILSLKSKLPKAKTNYEIEHINSAIDNYKAYIDKYTDNSSGYILTCVKKINLVKQNLNVEQNENKKEILECALKKYMNNIKSHISTKHFNATPTQFRDNQKVNISPMLQVAEISKMCEEHQQELKEANQNQKQIFRNFRNSAGSER